MTRRTRPIPRPAIPPRVRPPVIVVAGTIQQAQGYAFTLPDRHVEVMTRYRAVAEGGLHGLEAGTTIHVLAAGHPESLHAIALEAELEHLAASGVVVKAVRR